MGSNNNKSIRIEKISIPITFIPSPYFNNSPHCHSESCHHIEPSPPEILNSTATISIIPVFKPNTFPECHQGILNLSCVCSPSALFCLHLLPFLSRLPDPSAVTLSPPCPTLEKLPITNSCSLNSSGPSELCL